MNGVSEVSNAELSILQVLWESGRATIRQLTDRLYPGGRASHYATVQKLLERLEEKRCVSRDRSSMTHVFQAIVSRDDYIGGRLREMAQKLCGGSLTPLLTHLLQTESLSVVERTQLRQLLNEQTKKD